MIRYEKVNRKCRIKFEFSNFITPSIWFKLINEILRTREAYLIAQLSKSVKTKSNQLYAHLIKYSNTFLSIDCIYTRNKSV